MSDNSDQPDKITLETPNFQTELAAQIAEIVPEVISDGRLDVTKLRDLINGDEETSQEKFGLFWPGKQRAQAVAQLPTTATLKPAPEESVDWGTTKNIFIEGDNLEVLKVLQDSYRKKIKMIYIDPPYNKEKDFIYPDNFAEGLKTYLEYTNQVNELGQDTESKKEIGGRKHSNWLSMMYPRLQLAKSLLTDDGVIFINIDDSEQSRLKSICDEIFDEPNFIGQFIWFKKLTGGHDSDYLNVQHDYILVYARNKSQFNMTFVRKESDYKLVDEEGRKYKWDSLWTIGGLSYSQSLDYPIIAPDGTEVWPLGDKGIAFWLWGKDRVEKYKHLLKFTKAKDGSWRVYKRVYASEGLVPGTMLDKEVVKGNTYSAKEIKDLFGVKVFDYPKPSTLIEFLVERGVSLEKNDIVLDFFAGSGTTAQAVMDLNIVNNQEHRYICVQLPEIINPKNGVISKNAFKFCETQGLSPKITELAKERIRRAASKLKEDHKNILTKRSIPLDIGFRVYKLSSSNFMEWDEEKASKDPTQAVLDFAKNKKVDSTPEELLTEIMLRSRITLDTKVEKKTLTNGGWVYVVNDGSLIAYVLDDQLTVEQATEIADMSPAQFVAIDAAFNNNDALKINIANICREKHVGVFKTI